MNQRGSLSLLMFSFIIFGTNNVNVFADSNEEGKPPKSVCIEESEKENKEFDRKVLTDIVKSFNVDLTGYQEFTHDDLNLKVGDNLNDYPDKISLQQLFVGSSIGSRRLFLENGLEGTKGYFLFKRIDGNNVLKELRKMGKVWVVMTVIEKKSVRYRLKPFNWDKCMEN